MTEAGWQVEVLPDPDALADAVADVFVRTARDAVAERSAFGVALSGGSTPRAMFERLAKRPRADQVPWDATHVFWSDERAVPPDHPESNYRLAADTLLDHVPIPGSQVHRVRSEEDVTDAALHADAALRAFGEDGVLDLVLLGLGSDGHTASLFPGTDVVERIEAGHDLPWIVSTYVPQLDTHRITFTVEPIVRARSVVFVVSGAAKAPAVRDVFSGSRAGSVLPARLIASSVDTPQWWLDRDAASELAPDARRAGPLRRS